MSAASSNLSTADDTPVRFNTLTAEDWRLAICEARASTNMVHERIYSELRLRGLLTEVVRE